MKNKFGCPKCGGQLYYWQEYSFTKERNINKQTGTLNKRTIKGEEYELDTSGIYCRNCDFEMDDNHYFGEDDVINIIQDKNFK